MEENNKIIIISEERLKRYNDKLEYLDEVINYLNEWTKDVDVKQFLEDLDIQKKYGILHAFQITIEIITDITAMIVKDLKIVPKDDYSNIEILKRKKVINSRLAAEIIKANGLRNRIVHDYNGLDEELLYINLLSFKKNIKIFEDETKKWLRRNC
jgi:uncharacterized protein YutE (UPF0331/DUF86 family)